MPVASQLRKELREKREAFVEFTKTLGDKATAEDFEKAQKVTAEIEALEELYAKTSKVESDAKRFQAALDAEKKADRTPDARPPMPGGEEADEIRARLQNKSLGERFVESEQYKAAGKHSPHSRYTVEIDDIDYKATMTTTAGFAPRPTRTGRVQLTGFPRPVVADLMPNTPTDQAAIIYMSETTATNGADAVAEAALKSESTLVYSEVTAPLTMIATWLKVTNQQLDDVPQVRSLIDNRLSLFIELKEEDEILNGTGTNPHLQGIMTLAGTQAITQGTDTLIVSIAKAQAAIQNNAFDEPSAVVMNPTDWVGLATSANALGIYYFPGGPTEKPTMRIWGMPVVTTPKIAAKKILVGAFSTESELFRRMAITIAVGLVNDDFIKNLQTIRAEERVGVAWYKAPAFAIVTAA